MRKMEHEIKGLERYFYRRPNSNVIMLARIRGNANEERLRTVLNNISKRHLLLSVRIEQAKDGRGRFKSEGVPPPSLSVVPWNETDGNAWIEKTLEELQHRFEPDRGPLVRYTLLKGPELSYLIVNCHHTICDGLSLVYLLRDIFTYWGNAEKEIEPLPEAPILADNVPSSSSIRFYHKILISRFNKQWHRKPKVFTEEEYKSLHKKFWKMEGGISITHWHLSEQQTTAFAKRCKKEGVTVHSALCTVFLLAQLEVEGSDLPYLRRTAMPVSVRKMLSVPVPEIVCSYFSYFTITLKNPGKSDFWENTKAIQKKIKKRMTEREMFMVINQLIKLHPTLIDSLIFTKYHQLDNPIAKRFLKIVGNYDVDTGINISNLGRFEIPKQAGDLVLEEVIGPSIYREYEEKYLGVVTVNGKMHFTITHRELVVSTRMMEKIRDSVMRQLDEAVGL